MELKVNTEFVESFSSSDTGKQLATYTLLKVSPFEYSQLSTCFMLENSLTEKKKITFYLYFGHQYFDWQKKRGRKSHSLGTRGILH